jgi:TolB-like protein
MLSGKLKNELSMILAIVFIFVIIGVNDVVAAESIKIAILDFESIDTSQYAAKAVSEFISTEMAKKNELTVIERTQMGAILSEQGFQQTGCTEQECAVEMGKLLSAKKILLGTLTKTGEVLTITAKSVDVETGRIEFAESERCMNEDDLELASKVLAVKLANHISGTSYTIPVRTYKQDESRNKFGVGFFFKYGITKNVNVPVTKGGLDYFKIQSAKTDLTNQSVILSPSYEFTDNIGIRMDFKYMSNKIKEQIVCYNNYSSTSGSITESMDSTYETHSGNKNNQGYGLALNLQLIYPVDGFNFYFMPGIGLDKYSLQNPNVESTYSHYYNDSLVPANSYSYTKAFDIEIDTSIYAYIFKLETGFSVYLSRYVDLHFQNLSIM